MLRPLISVHSFIRSFVHSLKSKDVFLCIISATFLILPYCNGNLWIFTWFGFVPLFFAIKNQSKGKAFLLAYFTGIIFWFGTIYWLIHVTLAGLILLILYLSLYIGIFGLIIATIDYRLSTIDLLFIPSIWVLLEYIRSFLFTGFGWALLGYSQYLNLPVIQIADITGVWGVSFLIMMVNLTVYSLIAERKSLIAEKKKYLIIFLLLVTVLSYGYYKIHKLSTIDYRLSTRISVIQANIPQELKWDPDPRAKYFIIERYLALTGEALKDRPDLVIWPEASLPVVLEEEPSFFEAVKDFAKEHKVSLLLGAVTTKNNFYYNSAILVSKTGALSQQYDKLHLVPFGEYIPLKKILPFLQTVVPIGEITPGQEYTVFTPNSQLPTPNSGRFSVLICFEDLFPEISRRFVKDGAGFLVNITNDAWYKETSAPYQHLQASVLRAVENRVYLARAANTGISGFINSSGKIISLVKDTSGKDIFVQGYKTQEIYISKSARLSFYSRFQDMFIFLCAVFVVYYIILLVRTGKTGITS